MKRYYVKEETPLKFHKFMCVWSWFLLLACLSDIIQTFNSEFFGSSFPWLSIFTIFYFAVAVFLRLGLVCGLRKFARYAWYCVIGVYYATAVYIAVSISVLVYFQAYASLAGSIGQLVGTLAWAVPIHIYYAKRKPLFFNTAIHEPSRGTEPYVNTAAIDARYTPNYSAAETAVEPASQIRFCPQCGERVIPGGSFCGKGGAKLTISEN